MNPTPRAPATVADVLSQVQRPSRAVVTGGMPYANGPLHLGHLAGALVPPDIYARWLGLLIGRQNVLFVCGTDEHGSASEIAAMRAGKPVREFVTEIHDQQAAVLRSYGIGLDVYSGTSRADCFPLHRALSDDMLERLHRQGLLHKRASLQWFDPKLGRFLPDRFIRGRCPNPKCDNDDASGDECDRCGHQHEPSELLSPRSAVSDASPEQRSTVHWYLDIWAVAETLRGWVEGKKKSWRTNVVAQTLDTLSPSLRLLNTAEEAYKGHKASLPKHRQKYGRGKELLLQFGNRGDLAAAQAQLAAAGIVATPASEWGYRAITRDTEWGLPLPPLDPDLAGKTLYVWPDSLIAPIAFSKLALIERGQDPARYLDYWCDPQARIYQFLGQDNVFFYVIMQGALWLGMQSDPGRLPEPGELQLSEVFGCFHLLVGGEKMSKSRGNFYTASELLEKGYSADQLRYYLSLLGLADKASDFDFQKLDERNKFLAGPMNAVFERPLSAAHSKFAGRVPTGVLDAGVQSDTLKIVQHYVRAMHKADYPGLLFELERYGRNVNRLFTQYKPHDDRRPEDERANALFSAFFVLKNLMIMLYPFVPATMERLRESLLLPPSVFCIDELGTGLPPGHALGALQSYFPGMAEEAP